AAAVPGSVRAHARAETELRALRPRPPAGLDGRADLLVRVHVLRDVRRGGAPRRVPELRRRIPAAAGPAGEGVARDDRARERPAGHTAPPQPVLARAARGVQRHPPRRAAGRALAKPRTAPARIAGCPEVSPNNRGGLRCRKSRLRFGWPRPAS